MTKEGFRGIFLEFLNDVNPSASITALADEANLWDLGYIDSLRMVELMVFLSERVEVEVEIERYSADLFHSFNGIFEVVSDSASTEAS